MVKIGVHLDRKILCEIDGLYISEPGESRVEGEGGDNPSWTACKRLGNSLVSIIL